MGDLVKPNESLIGQQNVPQQNNNNNNININNATGVSGAPVSGAPVSGEVPTQLEASEASSTKLLGTIDKNIRENKSGRIKIVVKHDKFEPITLYLNESDTISQIKENLSNKTQIASGKQVLKYNGKELKDTATLLTSSITNGAELRLETPTLADKNNIEIEKLSVVMNTNKNSKVNLTAKLFVFDDNKRINGEYPLLCTNVEYDRQYLETKSTFFEKVQVFFVQSEFEKFVLEPKRDIITIEEEKSEIIKKNIMLMLEILFPISFPIKDDVVTVFKPNNSFDFQKMLSKVFRESQHVYLSIDRPSTVTQVIWLDTISSNPVYVQLYELMKKYKVSLVTYVLEKFARKRTDDSFKSNEFIQKIEDIIKRATYILEGTKGFKQLLRSFQDFRRQHDNMETNRKKTELGRLIKSLKTLLSEKTNLKFIEELSPLESSIKIDEADDKVAIISLFEDYKEGRIDDIGLQKKLENYKRHGSTWWKLYFIFAGFKKNTSAYNSFVEEYVKRHVLQTSDDDRRNWYYYNNQSSNESKFYKSLSDIKFHFEFLAKIEDFMTKRRRSLTKDISEIFQEGETYTRVQLDKYLSLFKRTTPVNAGVDRVQQSKSKDEEDKNATKQKFYEIQLGVALVGGKVPNAPSNFWCAFNSAKLANDYKFLTKYDVGEIQLYPYVDIEENPQAEGKPLAEGKSQQAEFGTILNLKKRGGNKTYRKTYRKKKISVKGFSRKKGR